MSKRQQKFERKPRDYYPTPEPAVLPLLPHLPSNVRFAEPCAGEGHLITHLEKAGHICVYSGDLSNGEDALDFVPDHETEYVITNPPWSRDILHPIIEHFVNYLPTWLLIDADWMHTKQAIPHLKWCSRIVSIGRVSWEQNGVSGFDNCCWYLFVPHHTVTTFCARS